MLIKKKNQNIQPATTTFLKQTGNHETYKWNLSDKLVSLVLSGLLLCLERSCPVAKFQTTVLTNSD